MRNPRRRQGPPVGAAAADFDQERILHAACFTPVPAPGRMVWGLPMLLEGAPGTAKTSKVGQFARRAGLPFKALSPSIHGRGAFSVVPCPVQDDQGRIVSLTYPPPDWCEAFTDGGFMLLDEAVSAGEELQAPILSLLVERMLGFQRLHPRVRTMGAANPADQGVNVHELKPALANRFGWLRWQPAKDEEIIGYMTSPHTMETVAEAMDALAEEARVEAAWGDAYSEAVGLWAGFMHSHSDWRNRCPEEGDPNRSRAWPSDRSWVYCVHAYAGATVHGLSPAERDTLCKAFVGKEAYEAWEVSMEYADLPAAKDVLDGRDRFQHNPKRLDRTAVMLAGCTALVTAKQCEARNERAERLWELLATVKDEAGDLCVPSVQALAKAKLHYATKAKRVLAKVWPLMSAAMQAEGKLQ